MNSYLKSCLSGIPSIPTPLIPDFLVSNRGKLRHLNTVNMGLLSLGERATLIRLSQACFSDHGGRLKSQGCVKPKIKEIGGDMTYEERGLLPVPSGLTRAQVSLAAVGLEDKGMLRYYRSSRNTTSTYFELAGAFNFRKDFKKLLSERRQAARRLKEERAQARKFRNTTGGVSRAATDMNSGDDPSKRLYEKEQVVTRTGNRHAPSEMWFQFYDCPAPDGVPRDRYLRPMPDTYEQQDLRLYPGYDVYSGLDALQTCVRFFFEKNADGYGRTTVDVDGLSAWLGRSITTRLSRAKLEEAIESLYKTGHLLKVPFPCKDYAFVRDSAQLAMEFIPYNKTIPVLHESTSYHHSTEQYTAFYNNLKALKEASRRICVSNDMINPTTLMRTFVPTSLAAEEWFKEYDSVCEQASKHGVTDIELCESLYTHIDMGVYARVASEAQVFWHAVKTDQPLETLNKIFNYVEDPLRTGKKLIKEANACDGRSSKERAVLRFIYGGLLPSEYLEKRNKEAGIIRENHWFSGGTVSLDRRAEISHETVTKSVPTTEPTEEEILAITDEEADEVIVMDGMDDVNKLICRFLAKRYCAAEKLADSRMIQKSLVDMVTVLSSLLPPNTDNTVEGIRDRMNRHSGLISVPAALIPKIHIKL